MTALLENDLVQGLRWRNAVMVALIAGLGAIVHQTPAKGEVHVQAAPEQAVEAEAFELEVPEELEDLQEMGEQVGDLLSEIDPEVIKRVMRPVGRQALRIFLDSAPGLSQQAIELGEEGLEKLEQWALDGLEQAQEEFELDGEAGV